MREREAAGPSGIGNRGRLSVPAETTEYTNALEIIDMLYVGFNGASLTGLSQDDIELSSKSKWLVCPENFPCSILILSREGVGVVTIVDNLASLMPINIFPVLFIQFCYQSKYFSPLLANTDCRREFLELSVSFA